MKLEKLFEAKGNRLYRLANGKAVDVSGMAETVPWSRVEPAPESYDEAFLAALRDKLKAAEAAGTFVFMEPVCDGDISTEALLAQFVAAMKHCARRIKDCASVAGFAIPDALAAGGFAAGSGAALFMEALSQKHAHYVYFCKKAAVSGKNCLDDIVLY